MSLFISCHTISNQAAMSSSIRDDTRSAVSSQCNLSFAKRALFLRFFRCIKHELQGRFKMFGLFSRQILYGCYKSSCSLQHYQMRTRYNVPPAEQCMGLFYSLILLLHFTATFARVSLCSLFGLDRKFQHKTHNYLTYIFISNVATYQACLLFSKCLHFYVVQSTFMDVMSSFSGLNRKVLSLHKVDLFFTAYQRLAAVSNLFTVLLALIKVPL